MSGEITIVENQPLTKQAVIAQKRLIQEVMESVMKVGTHYGVIPGCKQPSLWKAGSETILSTFRIAVKVNVEDLSTIDCFRHRVTVQGIIPTGEIVGEGVGECSTDEEKYHWRSAVNDKEFEATPEDRRRIKYSRPSTYNKEGETKQVRTNPADLANTVLKMAKKRAQIDLTLTATGASDVFAQDLEDLPDELREELTKEEGSQKQGKPSVAQPTSKAADTHIDNGDKATEGQVKMIHVKLKQGNVTADSFCAHYKIKSVSDLPRAMVNAAIIAIGSGEIHAATPAATTETKESDVDRIQCRNCGEMIDPMANTGHLDGCTFAE